jgi:hypothetical protein
MSGVLFQPPWFTPVNSSGRPYPGAKLYAYRAGTTTLATVYSTSALNVTAPNPAIANSAGQFDTFYTNPASGHDYKYVLTTSAGAQLRSADNVPANPLTANMIGLAINPRSEEEITAGVTPTTYTYPVGDPRRYGAVGDGVTDDTIALQAWASVAGYKFGLPLTYKVTGQITCNGNETIDWNGMVIDGSSGSSFTNNAVVYVAGSLTQIADLSVSPSANDVELTFDGDHGLVSDDVAIIYNPTDSSWSGKQTYYRAGEYVKVAIDTASDVVKLYGALYAGYTAAAVDVYKMTRTEVTWSNLRVISPNSGNISPMKISRATRVRLHNCQGEGSNYTSINLERCFDVVINGCNASVPVQVSAAKYGISVGNSQHVRIGQSTLFAVRHAVNIGGDDLTCAVPNRDVWVHDCQLANDAALSLSNNADVHGNSQDIWYVDCEIRGGASFGGRDVHYIGCHIHSFNRATGSLILGGSEWLGGIAEVRNCRLRGALAYSLGLVRLFTDANANSDSTLIVEGCSVYMDACDIFARIDVTDDTYKVNAVIRDITFQYAPALVQVLRAVGDGSGGEGDFVVVDGIENAPSGTVLLTQLTGYAATSKKLMQQMGTAAVTPVSGAASATAAVTFRYAFGVTPYVMVSHDAISVNSKPIGSRATSKGTAGFVATVYTCDAANFGAATPVVNVDYIAGVSE